MGVFKPAKGVLEFRSSVSCSERELTEAVELESACDRLGVKRKGAGGMTAAGAARIAE